MGPMDGFWTMKWEQRLPCATLPGLALLWDPPPFDYSPYCRGVQGIMKRILRPQETEGHKLEESGPPVPVWKSSHWIPTLNFGESKKTKKQKQPFYCVIPSRVWSLLELFSSSQSLSCVRLFATPWTAARQASLSIANSWSLLKLMSIVSVMPSNHLIFCHPLLLLPSIFPSIRVFSDELVLHIRYSNYWSFSFSISPSNE